MLNKAFATIKSWPLSLPAAARRILIVVAVLITIAGTVAVWQLATGSGSKTLAATMPLSPEIEERFGIRFTFMAVTAKSGMIDLRYRVVDQAKAKNFGHYTETSPRLIDETTGKVVDVTWMGLHNHRVEPGRVYYILYRNTDSAITPGKPVTIAIDNLKLEHAVPW